MKRFFLGIGGAILFLLTAIVQPVGAKDTNNSIINSFDVEYHLSRDTEGRSVLKTTEKITATFPASDQNHGLERAIPSVYDGHTTRLAIDSVKNAQGEELPYSESSSNDNTVLRIGDADTYVHGSQTYILQYAQHDVTRFFSNTNADELYWDVNGTEWAQRINAVSARVIVDESLRQSLTGKASCYQGKEGSTDRCSQGVAKKEGVFEFKASRALQPNESLTFALGFTPHTFAAYQQSAEEKLMATLFVIWMIAAAISTVLAVATSIWIVLLWQRTMNRVKGRGTIVPEYLPPRDASVLVSAHILKVSSSAVTAQLLDLAVRHYVKIYQTKDKKMFQSAEYELEVVKDTADLSDEERTLVKTLFGKTDPKIGTRFAMKDLRSNYKVGQKLVKNSKALRDTMRSTYGYYEKALQESKKMNKVGVVLLIVGIFTLSPLAIIASIVAFSCAQTLWPLTSKGVELRDYLAGLKLYIEVAEEERLKLLQSPEGAEKVGDIVDKKGALVKLYERVLPYAVLYGTEKEWMKQLGVYYDEAAAQPDWYAGTNGAVFNAAVFSASLSSFSDQSTSYSSPSSSSSGGSDGGGSSGGGGGGGGGGGW